MSVRLLSRIPLRFSVPVLIATPVLIAVVILSIVAYLHSRRTADDLASQNMQQIHSRIEEHLTRLMDMPPVINELCKRMLAKGQLSLTDMDFNREPVFETLNIFQDVSSVVIGKATGQAMWVIRYPGETSYEYAIKPSPDAFMTEYALGAGGEIVSKPISEYEFHPALRPWYTDAIAADGPTWGKVYVWVRGGKGETLGIPYVEPLRDAKGHIVGVVDCEMTLSDISMYLARLQVGKTGKAFIMEPDGNLVATSVEIECMKVDATGAPARLPASEATDTWIVQAEAQLRQQHGSLDMVEAQRLTVEIDGRRMRLVVSPYTNRRNLRWLIVTLVPEADFLAEVQAGGRRSMFLGLAAIGATVFLGVLLAGAMVRPIVRLLTHVRQIGQGDLDGELHLTQSPELVRLSTEINDMSAGLRDRLKMRQSLALAMDVQQNLLPTETPSIDGLDIAGHSTYCDETGGDYYDFLDITGLSPTTVSVAIGDVVGHGIAAAMVMAGARGILRSHCGRTGSLAELLQHMNSHLCHDAGDARGRFMTMFLMTLNPTHHELRWASAGHDMPFIYEPGAGFHRIDGGGVPLGVIAEESYEEYSFDAIRSGQIILVATDGVWETFDRDEQEFGKGRICDLIERNADRTADEISHALQEELSEFRGDGSQLDDITLIVIKVL